MGIDDISSRIKAISEEMNAQSLEPENHGHEFSQDELRARFENLKRVNSELGRAQFDMTGSSVWEYMEEEDRQAILGLISETITGMDMIKEAMGESTELNYED